MKWGCKNISTTFSVVIFLVLTAVFSLERLPEAQERSRKSSLGLQDKFVFVSTLDGKLTAIDPKTGKIKWTLNEEPVIKVPVTVQSGFTFLPDPQDGTLYGLSDGSLKKFPFTIPQLVQASPCKSTEGILYAGSKKDVWFAIDPTTGEKMETLSQGIANRNRYSLLNLVIFMEHLRESHFADNVVVFCNIAPVKSGTFSDAADKVCPASHEQSVFIGRTEYQLTMFDSRNRLKKWNGTFTDYSSHVLPVDLWKSYPFAKFSIDISEDTSYNFQHFSSSADGLMLTVDSQRNHSENLFHHLSFHQHKL